MSKYIYVFANPDNDDYIIMGCAKNINETLSKINSFDFKPFSFMIYATYKCSDRVVDEDVFVIAEKWFPNAKTIDMIIEKKKVRFYKVPRADSLEMLKLISKINDTEAAISIDPRFQTAKHVKQYGYHSEMKEGNFRFSECNIAVGETIEYKYNRNIKATVYDDTHILYEGHVTNMTALARTLTGSNRKDGPRLFLYKGQPLTLLRKAMNTK